MGEKAGAGRADESPVRRKWRGVAPDTRTAERRERIIEAAVDLLSTEGLAGTSVRAVCARTGLHSRYFYESFPGIDALLVAVFDRLAGEFLDYVTAAADAAGEDARPRIQAVMQATAEVFRHRSELVRILTVEAVGNEELNQRRIEFLHRIAALIEADSHRAYDAARPGRLPAVSARFLAGGLAEIFVAWMDGALGGTIEELAADATELVLLFSEATRQLASARPRPPSC